ncbi:MAG: hypothetical protein ACKV2V_06780 [Blastocatellia bacterium]
MREVRAAGFLTLIFLDNLDRIGRMDSQDDANTIAALIKQLLELPDCTLLINLRSQFTHHTVDRRELRHFVVEGLKPEALLAIYQRRHDAANMDNEEKQAVALVPVGAVAEQLSRVTNNPLAFLRWLDFWLTGSDNNPDNLATCFREYLRHNFTGVDPRWLRPVVEELRTARDNGLDDIPLGAMDKAILSRLEHAGTLVPDSLLADAADRRYRLNHDLDFLFDPAFASILGQAHPDKPYAAANDPRPLPTLSPGRNP